MSECPSQHLDAVDLADSRAGLDVTPWYCELSAGHTGKHEALIGYPNELHWGSDSETVICPNCAHEFGVF